MRVGICKLKEGVYILPRTLEKIALKEIIEIIDGQIDMITCLRKKSFITGGLTSILP